MINLNQDLRNILCDLIKITSETGNEEVFCDLLYRTLAPFNEELVRENNSLVLHTGPVSGKRIALIGHIDTVPVGESTTEAYEKDDIIWGRGACDMKAGLAVMLKIINEIHNGSISPENSISFVFYEGEEGPIPNGINLLLDKGHLKNVDFSFILEPTEGKYSVGCLGSLAVKKEVSGVSAHSANPKTGKNALDEAMSIYNKIREMNSLIDKVQNIDGLEFYETVNVTSINTFNAFNVLPPRAELMVNFRFSPERSLENARNLLFSCIGEEGTTIPDQVGSSYAGKEIEEFLLKGIDREIMQAWTDMAQLNEAGIPAINFGPGSIKLAHKPDERISVEELESFYTKLIQHL